MDKQLFAVIGILLTTVALVSGITGNMYNANAETKQTIITEINNVKSDVNLHKQTDGHKVMDERVDRIEESILQELTEIKENQVRFNCMILKIHEDEKPTDCL